MCDTNRSTCSTTRSEYGRRGEKDPSKRVAGSLSVDQEEVLIAMMFDDFMSTGMQSLDYDRVVRCAVTIQTDGDVCNVLSGSAPVPLDECWIPDDACEQPLPPTAAQRATGRYPLEHRGSAARTHRVRAAPASSPPLRLLTPPVGRRPPPHTSQGLRTCASPSPRPRVS